MFLPFPRDHRYDRHHHPHRHRYPWGCRAEGGARRRPREKDLCPRKNQRRGRACSKIGKAPRTDECGAKRTKQRKARSTPPPPQPGRRRRRRRPGYHGPRSRRLVPPSRSPRLEFVSPLLHWNPLPQWSTMGRWVQPCCQVSALVVPLMRGRCRCSPSARPPRRRTRGLGAGARSRAVR